MIYWLLTVVAVEATVEIITSSALFEPFHMWLGHRTEKSRLAAFVSGLTNCGYCMSVWVAASLAWALPEIAPYVIIDILIKTFAVHRLSNLWHEIITRILDRMPILLAFVRTDDGKSRD